MRCTQIIKLSAKGKKSATDEIVVNPARVDRAGPHEAGTVLTIGPDQVLVLEDFNQVAATLEAAWAPAPAFNPLAILQQLGPMIAARVQPAPAPALEGGVKTVRCGNCSGAFAPQEKCPGCGSALTS